VRRQRGGRERRRPRRQGLVAADTAGPHESCLHRSPSNLCQGLASLQPPSEVVAPYHAVRGRVKEDATTLLKKERP